MDTPPQSVYGRLIDRLVKRHDFEFVGVDTGAGSRRGVLDACERALRNGRVVLIASDVYVGRSGAKSAVEVAMAGSLRKVGPGPALLALSTGVPVVCVASYQDKSHRSLGFSARTINPSLVRGADRVKELSQLIADGTSELVRRHADQWLELGGVGLGLLRLRGGHKTLRELEFVKAFEEVADIKGTQTNLERPLPSMDHGVKNLPSRQQADGANLV